MIGISQFYTKSILELHLNGVWTDWGHFLFEKKKTNLVRMYRHVAAFFVQLLFILHRLTGNQILKLYFAEQKRLNTNHCERRFNSHVW